MMNDCSAWDMIDVQENLTIHNLSLVDPTLFSLTHDLTLTNRLQIEALYERAAADQFEEIKEVWPLSDLTKFIVIEKIDK